MKSRSLGIRPSMGRRSDMLGAVAGSTLLVGLLMPYLAQAQTAVTADTSQAGKVPIIRTTADQVKYVDIAKANAAGVSHNRYTALSVGTEGLIFNNNAGTAGVAVQLSDKLLARNAALGGTAAAVILNEVTSTSGSSLNGKLEVGGMRADLIVANPNGIVCDGCGFINAGNAALIAGKVYMNSSGALDKIDGTSGVSVKSKGLSAPVSKALWLYGKTIGVEGRVSASNDINVVASDIPVPALQADRTLFPTDTLANTDGVRLNVTETGSMYGDNIRIYSVRNGADIQIRGVVEAKENLAVHSRGSITVGDGTDAATTATRYKVTPNDSTTLREQMNVDPRLVSYLLMEVDNELSDQQFMSFLTGDAREVGRFKNVGTSNVHAMYRFKDTDNVMKVHETIYNSAGVKISTKVRPLSDWTEMGKSYSAALQAGGIGALDNAITVGGGTHSGVTFQLLDVEGVKVAPWLKQKMMSPEVYDNIRGDLESDVNSVYWNALERYAADRNTTRLKSTLDTSLSARHSTNIRGVAVAGRDVTIGGGGAIVMRDTDVTASGDVSVFSNASTLDMGALDQRVWVNLGEVNGGSGKLKDHWAEKKLGGRGVNINASGGISLKAQGDMTVAASELVAKGDVSLVSHGDDLTLENGKMGLSFKHFFDGGSNDEDYRIYDEDLVPSVIRAGGKILLSNDGAFSDTETRLGRISVASSALSAGYYTGLHAGNLATTGGDINISGRGAVLLTLDKENDSRYAYEYHKKSTTLGLGSKSTTTMFRYAADYDIDETEANGLSVARYATQLTGDNINITSASSRVVVDGGLTKSDTHTRLAAKTDLVVEAPVFNAAVDQYTVTQKSGLHFGKFLKNWSFSLGNEVSSYESDEKFVKRAPNVIDAKGDLAMDAGRNVEVVGSVVQAGRNIDITGRDVLVDNALGSYEKNSVERYKSTGFTVALTGAVIDKVKTVQSLLDRAKVVVDADLRDVHMVHAGVAAAAAAEDIYDVTKNYLNAGTTPGGILDEFSGGKGVGVSISYGVTSRKTSKHEYQVTGLPSSISTYNAHLARNAGESDLAYAERQVHTRTGNVNLKATGVAADGYGFVDVKGSTVSGYHVNLASNADTRLRSFESSKWAAEATEAKNASIGVTAYASTSGNLGVFIGAGGSLSNSSTSQVERIHKEAVVNARGWLSLTAGDDLVMAGASAYGGGLKVNVHDDLVMTSMQDYSRFNRKSWGVNGSVNIPVWGVATNTAASAGFNSSAAKALHKAVVEKTALSAGGSGFDIKAGGTTSLNGAVITSDAIPARNRLETGSFAYTNITNESKVDMKSEGYAISVSGNLAADPGANWNQASNFKSWSDFKNEISADVPSSLARSILTNVSLGLSVSDAASSITKAAVAPGTLIVKSGTGAAGLSRVASAKAEKLANVYDRKKTADRAAYAAAVFNASMEALNLYAEKMTENAKVVQKEVEGRLGAVEAKQDAAWKAAAQEIGTWDNSGASPGAAVAALRGGLQVLKATMAHEKVAAGGTGLIVAQMAGGIADHLAKDTPLYGNVFQQILPN